MFTIRYENHDAGCTAGSMVRDTAEAAARTAELMRACGYQTVTITG
jgi:hypothetical protein